MATITGDVIPAIPSIPTAQTLLPMPTKIVMKHNTVSNRTFTHDGNTLIECAPFSTMGKIQPFLISLSTNVCFMIDFHSHLIMEEVNGYLGGQWDSTTHTLSVTHVFPCAISQKKEGKNYPEKALEVEKSIREQFDNGVKLVGWYHSHPLIAAAPTLRDIDAQLDYQIKLRGSLSDNSDYTPCVGIICSPYHNENPSLESTLLCYWVTPPSENKPYEYGRPMLMSYSVVQDAVITPAIMDVMKCLVAYYKNDIDFDQKLASQLQLIANLRNPNATFLDKLKTTLSSKLPREQPDKIVWGFIREILGCQTNITDEKEKKPSVSPNDYLPLLLGNASDPSLGALFPPNPALLGLTDPLRASLANNMFLPPLSFPKMQDPLSLLKPFQSEYKSRKESGKRPRSSSSATSMSSLHSAMNIPASMDLSISSLMANPFLKPSGAGKLPDYGALSSSYKSDILNQMLDMTTNAMKGRDPKFNAAMDLSNLLNLTKPSGGKGRSKGHNQEK